MKLLPLRHDGYAYPKIVIYQPLDRLQPRLAFAEDSLVPQPPSVMRQHRTSSRSWDNPPRAPPANALGWSHGDSVNALIWPYFTVCSMTESRKVIELLPERVQPQGQSDPVKRPRKTHVQLYNEVFRSVLRDDPQQANLNAVLVLPPNPHSVKRKKTHQALWREVFPNGPERDVPPALASPVPELPTINQTPRLGRSRSATITRTQPAIGVSRIPSLRLSQPPPPIPAPPASLPGRMRAMSRATVRPTVDAEPSTRTRQISLSFLSRSTEENPLGKENSSVSTPPSQARRLVRPPSESIVQRTAHILTQLDGE